MAASDALGSQRRPVVSEDSGSVWGVRKTILLRLVMCLLFGLCFGFVLDKTTGLVVAVDKFYRSGESSGFTAFVR